MSHTPPLDPGHEAGAGGHALPDADAAGHRATLWVSWQLDGGAAAVNEAGRMRMQTYRLSLSLATGDDAQPPPQVAELRATAWRCCAAATPSARCSCPGTTRCARASPTVERDWAAFRAHWTRPAPADVRRAARRRPRPSSTHIDALVGAHRAPHVALDRAAAPAADGDDGAGRDRRGACCCSPATCFVLEPVAQLKQAIERMQARRLQRPRRPRDSSDEFGTLADGFNEHGRAPAVDVPRPRGQGRREDVASCEEKRERLEALYDVTRAGGQRHHAGGARRAASRERVAPRRARRRASALRWSDEANQRFLLLAADGLPRRDGRRASSACMPATATAARRSAAPGVRVIPIAVACRRRSLHALRATPASRRWCRCRSACTTALMGEVDLFYHAQVDAVARPSARCSRR